MFSWCCFSSALQTFVPGEATASYLQALTQLTALEHWLCILLGSNIKGDTEVRKQNCHLASEITH